MISGLIQGKLRIVLLLCASSGTACMSQHTISLLTLYEIQGYNANTY